MENKIIDESGDKSFFTIIPNYILNHSSDTDQSLYMQMKKVAGENGRCYVTEQHLCEKMKIGRKKLWKSLNYLMDHKWITFIGKTQGKTRPINTYTINDIWKLNTEHYQDKKILSKRNISFNDVKDTGQKEHKIPVKRTQEEYIYKEDNNNIIVYTSLKDIKDSDLEEIAMKYQVSLGFVKLQYEKLANYCESKGRKYKNYKAALRNFVLGDMQRNIERPHKGGVIDATNI